MGFVSSLGILSKTQELLVYQIPVLGEICHSCHERVKDYVFIQCCFGGL